MEYGREIRVAAHKTLMEFLVEVQAAAPLVRVHGLHPKQQCF